jgi:hypothetical protein
MSLLLKSALPTKSKMQKEVKKLFNLTIEDRQRLTELESVLQPFEWATAKFQGNIVSLPEIIPSYYAMVKRLDDLRLEHAIAIQHGLLESLKERQDNLDHN